MPAFRKRNGSGEVKKILYYPYYSREMEGEGPLFASLTEGQALFWRSALRIRAAVRLNTIVGTFRSNDVDGNESVKKKWFNKQNSNFANESRFFVHVFLVFARLRPENA